MGNITVLPGLTTLDLPVDRVLDGAKEHIKDDVIVIGWDNNDQLYTASSKSNIGNMLVLVELAKRSLLSQYDSD